MKIPKHVGIFLVVGVIKSPLEVHDMAPNASRGNFQKTFVG